MANLSEHGYGYNAVSQKDKTREEREESLYRDCERNLASHKKTKEHLIYCIIAVWAFCMIIQALGFISVAWALGVGFMNIFAFNYGRYAHYEIVERAHYDKALQRLEENIKKGE